MELLHWKNVNIGESLKESKTGLFYAVIQA